MLEASVAPPTSLTATTGDEANVSSFGAKKGTGSSGASLCHHTKAEHATLDKAQKNELREWRQKNENKGSKDKSKDSKKPEHDNDKAIAAAVEKKVAEKLKAVEDEKTSGEEAAAFIMSVVKKHSEDGKVVISDANVEPAPPPTGPTLKSILKRAKNAKNAKNAVNHE
jgi:hypothetical protein